MRKFKFKTRMQIGWFKAAIFGTAVAMMLVPTAIDREHGGAITVDSVVSAFDNLSFVPKVKVMINGDVVALAKSEEAAKEAFLTARLAYNAEGVKILNVDVTYEEVDKEKDRDVVKGMRTLRGERLVSVLQDSFASYENKDKAIAYTMRIDDYTVTLHNMKDVVSLLEQAQGQYDETDAFQVGLEPPASRNVSMYEVEVKEKEAASSTETVTEEGSTQEAVTQETSSEEVITQEENTEEATTKAPVEEAPVEEAPAKETPVEESPDQAAVRLPQNTKVYLTGETIDESQEAAPDETPQESQEDLETEEGSEETTPEGADENTASPEITAEVSAEVAAQSVNDGVKFIGFAEDIQVTETYVKKEQIKDRETAYNELTLENPCPDIYVVQPGDCLSIIAEKVNMTEAQIKELNPSIESDDDIYYDDRLNITVPKAVVQVLVEKQETYEEEYYEDIVYEDDDSMYIGESEVVQEGSSGRHVVTDLVTYNGTLETDREQLQETVQVAAIAQIVKRGTKSRPTYMYPVTNWNVTSSFGQRWGRLHAGIDVGIPVGTTVRASRGGCVTVAGWCGGYGNCVMIDHGDGILTVYGHLSQVLVSVGQYVDQGEQIALSGNTGRSTGPHLHFEVRVNGTPTDPNAYLNP